MNDTQEQAAGDVPGDQALTTGRDVEPTAGNAASAQGLTSESDVELAARLAAGREQIMTQLAKQIVGQEEVLGQVLMLSLIHI